MKKSVRASPVVVRRLRADDVDVCAGIVGQDPLWRRYGTTSRLARQAFGRALAAYRRGGEIRRVAGEVAVARQGNRVVGFIWFRLAGTFHHSGYVRWVVVAPEARSRGVGRRLMRYAEERIFREGPNVFLLVSEFNVRARAFYRRLGYTQVGAILDYIVPGITERLYRKSQGTILNQRRGQQ